jgi:TonB family protein
MIEMNCIERPRGFQSGKSLDRIKMPAMRLWFFSLVLVAATCLAQNTVQEQNAELARYENTVLVLRVPYSGPKLRFKADGHPEGDQSTGEWMNSGFISVHSLHTDGKQIKIAGKRCVLAYDIAQQKLAADAVGDPVSIEIKQASPDAVGLTSAMLAVFEQRDVAERLKDYWHPDFDTTADWLQQTKGRAEKPIATLEGNRNVYAVTVGVVVPPKLVSAPDPVYPEPLRNARTQGTSVLYMVVDEHGDPALVSLFKSSDPAFDDSSIVAIGHWKFKPATLGGKPVAVMIRVEVNFRI